jgi:hypothetical protein
MEEGTPVAPFDRALNAGIEGQTTAQIADQVTAAGIVILEGGINDFAGQPLDRLSPIIVECSTGSPACSKSLLSLKATAWCHFENVRPVQKHQRMLNLLLVLHLHCRRRYERSCSVRTGGREMDSVGTYPTLMRRT